MEIFLLMEKSGVVICMDCLGTISSVAPGWIAWGGTQVKKNLTQAEDFQHSLDTLADKVEEALNMELLDQIIWEN